MAPMDFGFFAATQTSVYAVTVGKNGRPEAEKVARIGGAETSVDVGHKLEGAPLLGITGRGLLMYQEDIPMYGGRPAGGRMKPSACNTRYWGAMTSPIKGLFLTFMEAVDCMEGVMDSEEVRRHTQLVLDRIGDDDDAVVIETFDSLRLKVEEL